MNPSHFKDQFVSAFEEFEKKLDGNKNTEIHQLRKSAFQSFSSLPLPGKKDESWKYTNLDSLYAGNFSPEKTQTKLELKEIEKFFIPNLKVFRVVFVNGKLNEKLSDYESVSDFTEIRTLSDAIHHQTTEIKTYLDRFLTSEKQIFSDLNTAFLNDGIFIKIKNGKVTEKPIHLLFISNSDSVLSQPRNMIVSGKSSEATVIEHYISLDEQSSYLTNVVTNLISEENSTLHHIKIQTENEKSFHIGTVQTCQEKNSSVDSHFYSLGSAITRNNVFADLNDENANVQLHGLYLTSNQQHVDNHTLINHLKPNCTSVEVYKGILDDKSTGVFDGKIIVHPDAQKTNANQSNKNLLLSNEAHADAKPQLEIYADDVKCFHGATVGQLDGTQLFYLKSRGIGDEFAKAILTHAFAADILNAIKIQPLREYLDHQIMEKLHSPIEFE